MTATVTQRTFGAPKPRGDVLPAAARQKLIALQGQATDARDAAASATSRIGDLRKSLNTGGASAAEAEAIETEIKRLETVLDVQRHRQGQLSALAVNLQRWVQTLGRGITLEPAKPKRFRLDDDETAAQALMRLRAEIANATAQLATAKDAPLPKEDVQLRANNYVAELAKRGQPKVNRKGDVSWESTWASSPPSMRAIETMAWLFPERFAQRLEDLIDGLPDPDLVLNAADRRKCIRELEQTIEKLERDEEAAVAMCIADGVDVLRRANASPLAVLGVAIVKRESRAA